MNDSGRMRIAENIKLQDSNRMFEFIFLDSA